MKTNKIKLLKILIACVFQLAISSAFSPLSAADRIPYPASANLVTGATNYLKHGQNISFSGELNADGKYKVRVYGTTTVESPQFTISGTNVPYAQTFSALPAGSYNVKLRYKYPIVGWGDTAWSSTNPNTYYIDASVPTFASMTPANNSIVTTLPAFSWNVSDAGCGMGSGACQMIIKNSSNVTVYDSGYTLGAVVSNHSPATLTGGAYTYTINASDLDNNIASQTFNFTVDGGGPTGTITPTSGQTIVGNPYIYFNITASDTGKVKSYSGFTEGNLPATWITISPTTSFSQTGLSFTLSAGDGDKTVSIWYKDLADNQSAKISTTITLDADPPDPLATTFAGLDDTTGVYTNSYNVNMNLNAKDAGTGVAAYMIVEDLTTPTSSTTGWKSVTPQKYFSQTVTHTLSAGEGTKTLHVWYKDVLDHVSNGSSTATIKVDTLIPNYGTSGGATVSTVPTYNSNLNGPQGVAVDSAYTFYVADSYNHQFKKISPHPNANITFSTSISNPVGVVLDSLNNAYVTSNTNNLIYKITPGNVVTAYAAVYQPNGMGIDNADNLYVASNDNKIYKISAFFGNASVFAGTGTTGLSDGPALTVAQFSQPFGVAVDNNGNVYVSEPHHIRKISNGNVITLAGVTNGYQDDPIGMNAKFYWPSLLTVDNIGNVYVADMLNNKIRMIAPSGSVTTLAGSSAGYQDGSGLIAQFAEPRGITLDLAGNLYVTDLANSNIRKIIQSNIGGLLINNGAKLTTVRNIKAKIFATDKHGVDPYSGVIQYCLKLSAATPATPALSDAGWKSMPSTFSNSSPDTQEVDFTFDDAEPDGLKTFYIWYRDQAGNISPVISKSIKLDTHPPVEPIAGSIGIVGNPTYTSSKNITLKLHAESGADTDTVGLYDIKVTHYFLLERDQSDPPSADPSLPGGALWEAIATPRTPYDEEVPYSIKSGAEGTKEIFVWYKDVAGNLSLSSKCSIYFDDGVPNGSLKINDGTAIWTNSPAVKLTLKGFDSSGIAACYVSSDPLTPGVNATGWQSVSPPQTVYNAEMPFGLGAANGTKTVYAWYKNTLDSLSNTFSATIKLDSEAPGAGLELPGEWVNVGDAGFSASTTGFTSLFIHNGTPFVAYKDGAISDKATVMKFNGTNWVNVGAPGFSAGAIQYTSLFIYNGTLFIAYKDVVNSNKATVMKFDGTNWVNVGTLGFSLDRADYLSLYVDGGTPFVAYRDNWNGGKATVMKFDGTNWVNVGSPSFSGGFAQFTSLCIYNGTPFVAFANSSYGGGKATVMKFNGANWVNVGSPGFSAGIALYSSLCIDGGTPFVAYQDYGNGLKITVMKFNGTNWVNVGTPGFSSGAANYTSLCIYNGTPYVAYYDQGNSSKATVKKFDGTNWVDLGNPGFSAGSAGFISIRFDNGTPFVAYSDGGNGGRATVMKYIIPRTPDFTINNGAKYTSSTSVKCQIACEDDYSGIAAYRIAEDPTPPLANDASKWTTPPSMGASVIYSYTAEVTATIQLGKKITMYCWYKDNAGNISKASTAVINGPTMRAVGSLGDSSQLSSPESINLCSSDAALLVSDHKSPGTTAFKYTDLNSSTGSRLGTTGYQIDQLDSSLAGIVPLSGGYFGVLESSKKRFSIFDGAGNYLNSFTKNINMAGNIHGLNTSVDLRAKLSDKYSMTSSYNLAEVRVSAGQNPGVPTDYNFAASTIEVFTDAAYLSPVTGDVRLSDQIFVRITGAGGDSSAINSIVMKVKSSDDPQGISIQLIETGASSDIFTGSLTVGMYTNLNNSVIGAGSKSIIYLNVYSKTGMLNRTIKTKPKAPLGPIYIADLGGGVKIEMVRIPAGTFQMGQTGIATPVHTVTLTKDFYMSKYEITQLQWLKIMGSLASADKPIVSQSSTYTCGKGDNYPVYYVSWNNISNSGGNDFMTKINALNLIDGTFRLPTEAEWEYACRAGTTTTYYWGEDATEAIVKQYCWYDKNANSYVWTSPHATAYGTQLVGTKLPNAWGLYDMGGNVW